MTDYQLPQPQAWRYRCLGGPWELFYESPFAETSGPGENEQLEPMYAESAVAPLLEDLAAHEASNRIKSENLDTLRQQLADAQADAASWQQQASDRVKDWDTLRAENAKLREALSEIAGIAQQVDGWESFPQDAIDTAYAALGERE